MLDPSFQTMTVETRFVDEHTKDCIIIYLCIYLPNTLMSSVCQEKDDVYEELPLFELEKIYCTEEQRQWLKEKIVDRPILRETFMVSGRIALYMFRDFRPDWQRAPPGDNRSFLAGL